MTERRVLVLAYFFPPLGGAGVQRTLKFVRHLPAHGWEATVISTASRAYPVSDPSLLEEVPRGTRVVRAREPGAWRRLRLWGLMACELLRLRSLRALIAWPDESAGWGPGAVVAAMREVRRRRPDALFSTSAPYTAHLAAWIVHRLTGVPWVADFRDEWSDNPHALDQPRAARRLSRLAERAICGSAARVTLAADYFSVAGLSANRTVVIPNGVDELDLADLGPPEPRTTDCLRLSHVGTLYGDQDLAPVLAALRRLVDAGRLDPDELELRVVGNDWLAGLDERVPVAMSRTGYVDHRTALREMRDADALLLYVAPASRAPTGKLFEYLVSERPILCVARRDNLAFGLVDEWGAGLAVEPTDEPGIEEAVLELVARRRRGELHGSPQARALALDRYSRRSLAGRLAQTLEQAAGVAPR